jgi:hypothetical protein
MPMDGKIVIPYNKAGQRAYEVFDMVRTQIAERAAQDPEFAAELMAELNARNQVNT